MSGYPAKEDYAVVLDFLPQGKPSARQMLPVAQVIGEKYFILLEVIPKKDVVLKPRERVYIGAENRDKVHHILGRINMNELTQTARLEVQDIIEQSIDAREKEFVDFFNKAGPVTTRLHQLELLPGIGKKNMWKILEERDTKPFESFEDLKNRVSLIPNPKKAIVKRILIELEGNDKYRVFIR